MAPESSRDAVEVLVAKKPSPPEVEGGEQAIPWGEMGRKWTVPGFGGQTEPVGSSQKANEFN